MLASRLRQRSFPTCAAIAGFLSLAFILACSPSGGAPAGGSARKLEDGDKGHGKGKKKKQAKRAKTAGFAVHEWGLIGTGVNRDKSIALAAGPQAAARPVGLEPARVPLTPSDPEVLREGKPVIYVHLLEGSPVDLKITVAGRDAKFQEHWPDAVASKGSKRHRLTWKVQATKSDRCDITPIPTETDPRCLDLEDGFCELALVPSYRTTDAACLKSGDQRSDLLFYRAELPKDSLSLKATRGEDGALTLTRGTAKNAPATMLRIVRRDGKVEAFQLTPPAISASMALNNKEGPEGTLVADPAEWLRSQLDSTGLSGPEIDAFMTAWQQELTGTQELAPNRAPVGLAGSQDELLFLIPPAEVNKLMPLRISPRPKRTVRAFLGYIDLT